MCLAIQSSLAFYISCLTKHSQLHLLSTGAYNQEIMHSSTMYPETNSMGTLTEHVQICWYFKICLSIRHALKTIM
jgi:hypothetical protein